MKSTPVYTIYLHIHVESGRCYVGLTKRTMMRRWSQHVVQSRTSRGGRWHFPNAIRKYGPDAFSHHVLMQTMSLEDGNAWEEFWIEYFDSTNPEKGFNIASGGDHIPHPIKNPWDRPEFREKYPRDQIRHCHAPEARAKQQASMRTPESKARRSAATKESMARPEVRERRAEFQKDPDFRTRIAESVRASLADPSIRERMSESAKAVCTDEVRARISEASREAHARPDVKERHREAVREAQNRPELLEKRRAYRASPETKAKIAASSKGRGHTPEAVARMKDVYWSRFVLVILAA